MRIFNDSFNYQSDNEDGLAAIHVRKSSYDGGGEELQEGKYGPKHA